MPDLHEFDREIKKNHKVTDLIGMDEAGRGPLAGPVVAACVILDPDNPIAGLNDSKKLTEKRREKLFREIISKTIYKRAVAGNISLIEKINIRQATICVMERCLSCVDLTGKKVLIDGDLVLPNIDRSLQECIVKGDAKSAAIAAASILAKVSRDVIMKQYSRDYPEYCFDSHNGYGTKLHIARIKEYGLCPIHRPKFCSKFVRS